MDRRIVLGVVLVLVAIVAAAAIGTNAYRAGVARGLADSGKLPSPEAGGVPGPYYGYYGPYWHPGPFGFGFFGFLFPLLFLFLIFALFRGLFWGRRWAGSHGPWVAGPHGPSTGGVPPMFEEWHRRAHESMQERGQKA